MDCPICMDAIDVSKNHTTTECGHCFHSSCLMKSVAHNGFGCPYCRTVMAEEPDEDEDDSTFQADDEDEDEDEMFDDYALRGFRFFWNIANEEEIDEEDDADEEKEDEMEEASSNPNIPSSLFVSNKLRDYGITYEQLVRLLLYRDHDEYTEDDNEEASDALDRLDGEIFGKIRIIVSNYSPEQEQQQLLRAQAN